MADATGWVEVMELGERTVVAVVGDVDASNVEEIGKALEDATSERRSVHVVDLSRTAYFDSSGIRLLFELATRLQSRRQELHVVVPADGVTRRVLELTHLSAVVPIHESLDDVEG